MQSSPDAGASPQATEDVAQLAWVLEELRNSLQIAVRSLRRHAREAQEARAAGADAPDGSQLRIARTHLHQSLGVLSMLDLSGPAQVVRAMEGAADKLIASPELAVAESADKFERASFALVEYLEAVIAGRNASAVALFPQYAEVQKLAGAERAHPADLWSFRWRWLDPRGAPVAPALTYGAEAKSRIDPALLLLIRAGDKGAAQTLAQVFAGLAAGQTSARPRVFWKIAAAFMETLQLGLVAPDLHVKRVASKVLAQYGSLAKGEADIPERILLDLLFFCSQAAPQDEAEAPFLAAVRKSYGLARFTPVPYTKVQFGLFDPALLTQSRKRVSSVKEIWSAVSGGETNKLKGIAEPFGALCEALVKLHPPSAPLAAALAETVEATVRSGEAPKAELAMEVATSVLYLEAAFEDLDPSDVKLAERTGRLAERLRLVGKGGAAPPLESWMEDLFRRVSDRQTMGSVVGEMRTSLATVERSLDEFFRKPDDTSVLRDVPQQMGHMKGVLSVLGLDQAGRAITRMRDNVEQIIAAAPEAGGAGGTFEMLAGNLGALGFMFDMLSYQPALAKKLFVFDEQSGELKPVMGRSSEPEEDDDSMLEVEEAPGAAVETVANVEPQAAAKSVLDSTTQTSISDASSKQISLLEPSSAEPAGVVDAEAPASNFAPTDWLPEARDEPSAEGAAGSEPPAVEMPSFDFNLELGGPAPATAAAATIGGAPTPAPTPAPAVPAPVAAVSQADADIDDEMLEIFTEEASEVVQTGLAAVQNLRADGNDVEQATVLRRAFHTLKGSSRMVGLTEFGEAGWAMEQLFNALLADSKPITAPLCDLSQAAMEGFGQWAGEIAERKPQTWSASAFRASADAMRNEGRYLALEQVAPAITAAEAQSVTALPVPTSASTAAPRLEPSAAPASQEHRSAPTEMDFNAWGISEDVASRAPSGLSQQEVPGQPMEAPPVVEPFDSAAFVVDELPVASLNPVPEPVTAAPDSTPAFEPEDAGEDQYKRIGSLRISLGLYNIYLNEADERSRKLVTEASEWALEWQRPPADSMVALAHSLAGSSSTVGFTSLGGFARLMEHALIHVQAFPSGTEALGQCFHDAALEVSRLLHQFAAGFLREADPTIVARLQEALESTAPASAADAARNLPDPAIAANEPMTPDAAPSATGSPLRDDVDADVFSIFEEEAVELLPQITSSLRQWIADPADRVHRSLVLRGMHTLKGGARLAGAMRLGEMAHDMESDIEALGEENLSKSQIEPLLKTFDRIANHHERLARAVADGVPMQEEAPVQASRPAPAAAPAVAPVPAPSPVASTIASITADLGATSAVVAATAEPKGTPAPSTPAPAPAKTAAPAADQAKPAMPATAPADMVAPSAAPEAGSTVAKAAAIVIPSTRQVAKQVRVRSQLLDQLVGVAGEAMGTGARLEVNLGNLRGSLADLSGNLERLRTQLRDIELSAELQMQSRLALSRETAQGFDPLEFDRFTRVQELTRMMAESVNDVATIQRSLQRTIVATEDDLHAQARQTRELQRDLLRTRMVEFEGISERLHRVVRQAADDAGKEVRFELIGGAIEMDRGMLERMIPPFEHLLRNCVAHGIEDATQRIDSGKDPTGKVSISLEQDGNDVRIKVRDDGAGLNLARIRDKALAMGLIAPGVEVTDAEAANLILMPGFSTATQVTELAGRGIGMDVVRAEINAIGGRIETSSQPGKGTLFKMVLPLTTAVTQVVMLRAGEARVGVPAAMVELVHGATAQAIEQAHATGTLSLDGNQIPFFWAGALLHSSPASLETEVQTFPVMVLLSASQRVAMQVDEVLGHQEVVVKNLGTQLGKLPGLTGVSALPSGDTVLIYNPVALAAVYGERARRYAEESKLAGTNKASAAISAASQAPLVLVVDDSITVRRVTQRLLQREGYRVALAADGFFALERLAEERPVVMLSDIEMPRMNGFELVEKVRQDGRWEGLPIIMISSRSAEKHREHARQLGADDFLGKPYGEDELLALIEKFVVTGTAN